MAIFYPELSKIPSLKQQPTPGELHALNILKGLSDEYEIFFQPNIYGHQPDIVIVRKNYGVIIIEVKDWNLDCYNIDNDKWKVTDNGRDYYPVSSPKKQVKAYKDDLYDLSCFELVKKRASALINNKKPLYNKYYGIIQVAVYFHNEFNNDRLKNITGKQKDYCACFHQNNFTIHNFTRQKGEVFKTEHIIRQYPNKLFDDDIYNELKRILKPPFHTLEQGQSINLSKKQQQLAHSSPTHQKISGVAGSGKTFGIGTTSRQCPQTPQ